MSSREDDSFYSLGYTTPEAGEGFHVAQLEHQKLDKRTDEIQRRKKHKPRRPSSVLDFENDRDHADEMAAEPRDFVDEPYDGEPFDNPRMVTRILARRALTKSMAERFGGGDSPQYLIWRDNYNKKHPLPDADQSKGD